jgi:hypothetical protein
MSYHRKDLGLSVHKWVVYKRPAPGKKQIVQHSLFGLAAIFNVPLHSPYQWWSKIGCGLWMGFIPLNWDAFNPILEKLADLEFEIRKSPFRRLDLRGSIDAHTGNRDSCSSEPSGRPFPIARV